MSAVADAPVVDDGAIPVVGGFADGTSIRLAGASSGAGAWLVGKWLGLKHWLPKGQLLPEHVLRRRHHSICVLLWLHVPALFAFGMLVGHHSIVHATADVSAGRAVRAGRELRALPPEGARDRGVVRPDHLLGGARRPVGRDHRGALPLLRDDRRAHAVPGLDAVPGGDRLRRHPPRRRRRARPRRRLRRQPPGGQAPVGVGRDPRRVRARGERRPRRRVAHEREPAAARPAHRAARAACST